MIAIYPSQSHAYCKIPSTQNEDYVARKPHKSIILTGTEIIASKSQYWQVQL